jgi:hypothetical protein
MKICSKCGIEKEDLEFYADQLCKRRRGAQRYCKECKKQYSKEWYKNNADRQKIIAAEWRKNNKEHDDQKRKEWHERNKDKIKLKAKATRLSKYSLTESSFLEILEKQNGCCAICGFKFIFGNVTTAPCIDHDHTCCSGNSNSCVKCIRGLLCVHCNAGLGRFKDSLDLLSRAFNYIEESR